MADFTVGSLVMDGSDSTNQGGMYPHKSVGSRPFSHDLMTLHNLWMAPTQMLQLAPGMCWCKTCGDVRPNSYFDVAEWDERGKPTRYNDQGHPIEWDGIRFPTKWAPECKPCANAHDPKLRPSKYCSACRVEHPRRDFGDDERNVDGKKSICKDAAAKAEHERRARNAQSQGRELRGYQWAR